MKIGLNEPRKHHYVPRVYLKNFAKQEKKEWRITVADKTQSKLYIANIKDIAAENDFYRTDSVGDNFYWEHYYAEHIESIINSTFKNFISACKISVDRSYVINDEMRLKLAEIICSQLLRTKKARESQYKIGQRVAKNVIESIRKQYAGLLSEENIAYLDNFSYDEMLNKSISLPIINDEERVKMFINFLLERYWVVYKNINYKTSPLITSDHPVMFYNVRSEETDFSNNGLAIPHTVIFYPINRELIIGMYTSHVYLNQIKKLNNRMLIIDDVSFVMKLNRMQYEQCYRQAYFSFV